MSRPVEGGRNAEERESSTNGSVSQNPDKGGGQKPIRVDKQPSFRLLSDALEPAPPLGTGAPEHRGRQDRNRLPPLKKDRNDETGGGGSGWLGRAS